MQNRCEQARPPTQQAAKQLVFEFEVESIEWARRLELLARRDLLAIREEVFFGEIFTQRSELRFHSVAILGQHRCEARVPIFITTE